MFYLSGVFIAFFLSVILFTKKHKSRADYLLGCWLAVMGLHLLTFYLFFTGQHYTWPGVAALGFALPLAQGPFLYLYTLHQTSPRPVPKAAWLHFLPVLLSYLLFAEFFLMGHAEKVEVFRNKGAGFEINLFINVLATYLSGIVYVVLSIVRLLRYRRRIVHEFSNTEKINFNWLLFLILWLAVIWIAVLFVQMDEVIFGAAVFFVLWIGYYGIRQVNVFSHGKPRTPPQAPMNGGGETPSPPSGDTPDDAGLQLPDAEGQAKYLKSTLSNEEAADIHARLLALMESTKPYTNPELSLGDLAESLQLHPNLLSQVINTRENKTFYDLINEKRVDEFIHRVAQPGSSQFTLLAIAMDCGFNSKASFNRNFKKHKGYTPSEYLKQHPVANS